MIGPKECITRPDGSPFICKFGPCEHDRPDDRAQLANAALGGKGYGERYVFRAGDIVHHEPTGEDWVVAYVDGEHLAWCGWPAGEALARDCWLKKSSTDEEHRNWLELIAQSREGKRARMAQQALAALAPSKDTSIT